MKQLHFIKSFIGLVMLNIFVGVVDGYPDKFGIQYPTLCQPAIGQMVMGKQVEETTSMTIQVTRDGIPVNEYHVGDSASYAVTASSASPSRHLISTEMGTLSGSGKEYSNRGSCSSMRMQRLTDQTSTSVTWSWTLDNTITPGHGNVTFVLSGGGSFGTVYQTSLILMENLKNPAETPTSLHVSSRAVDSLTLQWTKGATNDCIFSYWSVIFISGGTVGDHPLGCTQSSLTDFDFTTCVASGLNNFVNYSFAVQQICTNEHTNSGLSAATSPVTTMQPTVFTPPMGDFTGVASAERPLRNNDERYIWSAEYGAMDVANNISMSSDAQFRIGSNSKLFTAISIYQLHEQGKLDVSHKVADYINQTDMALFGFPEQSTWCPRVYNSTSSSCENITFIHLMSMSSGMIEELNCGYEAGSPFHAYCDHDSFVIYPGLASLIGTFINSPLTFAPGSGYSYSNPNFILLTYLIEKLSGQSYRDYIREQIIDVIGLDSTYFDPFDDQFEVHPGKARGYWNYRNINTTPRNIFAQGECTFELSSGSLAGTGGIVSTQDDLKKLYVELFVNENSSLLTSESINAIVYPHTLMTAAGPGNPGAGPIGMYFAQGIVSRWFDVPPAQNQPNMVFYEGGTLCFHTFIGLASNITTGSYKNDPWLLTAFRSTVEVYVDPSDYATAQGEGLKNFFGAKAGWPSLSGTQDLGFEILAYLKSVNATEPSGGNEPSGNDQGTSSDPDDDESFIAKYYWPVVFVAVFAIFFIGVVVRKKCDRRSQYREQHDAMALVDMD